MDSTIHRSRPPPTNQVSASQAEWGRRPTRPRHLRSILARMSRASAIMLRGCYEDAANKLLQWNVGFIDEMSLKWSCVRVQRAGSSTAARRRLTVRSHRPTFPASTRATPSAITCSTAASTSASPSASPTSTSKASRPGKSRRRRRTAPCVPCRAACRARVVSNNSHSRHCACAISQSLVRRRLLGPFYGAIAVPSVTRCRCCCHGHRCAGGVRATVATPGEWQCGVRRLAVANGPNIIQMLLVYFFGHG